MSSHFILFHHFRPFNSVPFHFIHSISFHVIHLIPVYLSFIPLLSSIPSFNYSLVPFHPVPSPCHALPFHPIPFIHTHSLSIWGFAEMGETHIIKINEFIETTVLGTPMKVSCTRRTSSLSLQNLFGWGILELQESLQRWGTVLRRSREPNRAKPKLQDLVRCSDIQTFLCLDTPKKLHALEVVSLFSSVFEL